MVLKNEGGGLYFFDNSKDYENERKRKEKIF
jgi:hypothetical protein